LALRTLQFVVGYSLLQENVDWLAMDWQAANPLASRPPQIPELGVRRMRDVDSGELVVWLASQVGSSAQLEQFPVVFKRVKALRDHVAHALFLNPMVLDGDPEFGIPYYMGDAKVASLPAGRSSVTGPLLDVRQKEARWLRDQVDWIRAEAGYISFSISHHNCEERSRPFHKLAFMRVQSERAKFSSR
jgi:hypothetical protein